MEQATLTAGWQTEKHSAQRKYHYICDGTSLCGKLGFYRGGLEPHGNDTIRQDDCAECHRRLLKTRSDVGPKP